MYSNGGWRWREDVLMYHYQLALLPPVAVTTAALLNDQTHTACACFSLFWEAGGREGERSKGSVVGLMRVSSLEQFDVRNVLLVHITCIYMCDYHLPASTHIIVHVHVV